MKRIIRSKSELTFIPQNQSSMPLPKQILMVSSNDFDIDNAINPHMQMQDGQIQTIDKEKAKTQWHELKKIYDKIGFQVSVLDSVPGLLDMVFCANQTFPFLNEHGNPCIVLSNMKDDRRHREVAYVADFFKSKGYELETIGARQSGSYFEAMGDALWLPGKKFILGGYGFRTSQAVYERLSSLTKAPIAVFELKNPKFYHLDTCLSILNETTALACREAFTDEGWQLLESIFSNLLVVPLEEADSPGFACNAHCPDQKHVIIQAGCQKTNKLISSNGFIPIETETSEFIKSGGSVFCMKLMFW